MGNHILYKIMENMGDLSLIGSKHANLKVQFFKSSRLIYPELDDKSIITPDFPKSSISP